MSQDNLDRLPLELLMKIGLALPLKDVASICQVSSRLHRLCTSELFWEERLRVDFPQYVPTEPLDSSFKLYYEQLTLIKNETQRSVFRRPPYRVTNDIMYFFFPVPVLNLDKKESYSSGYYNDEGVLRADLIVHPTFIKLEDESRAVLIGITRRNSAMGPIPEVGTDILHISSDDVPRDERFDDVQMELDMASTSKQEEYYFISFNDLFVFLEEAERLGYVQFFIDEYSQQASSLLVSAAAKLVSEDEEEEEEEEEVVAPPPPRKKGIFDFLFNWTTSCSGN